MVVDLQAKVTQLAEVVDASESLIDALMSLDEQERQAVVGKQPIWERLMSDMSSLGADAGELMDSYEEEMEDNEDEHE